MILNLTIPPEAEAQLRAYAAAAGKDVESFVLEAVSQRLAEVVPNPGRRLVGHAWQREFDYFLASLPRSAVVVDDSRDSIYEERGA